MSTHCSNCFSDGLLGEIEALCVKHSGDGIGAVEVEAWRDFEVKGIRVGFFLRTLDSRGLTDKTYGYGFDALGRGEIREAMRDPERKRSLLSRVEENILAAVARFNDLAPEIPDGECIPYVRRASLEAAK